MKKLPAYLVHHTGSMIRFVTSQLKFLPKTCKDIYVILPSGKKLKCKFNPIKANPNITGPGLVHWLKGFIPFGDKKEIIVQINSSDEYFIYLKNQVIKGNIPKKEKVDLKELIKQLFNISKQPPKSRKKKYYNLFRKRINSDLVKKVFGVKCQVQDCEYSVRMNNDLMRLISDVHHLEHLSRGGSNSPYNLAVVCANHHAILHRDKTAKIIKHKGDNVLVTYLKGKIKKWICRDLSILHNQW